MVPSLEAAVWSFYRTDSFKAALFKAANFGDDADTTATICGHSPVPSMALNDSCNTALVRLCYLELFDVSGIPKRRSTSAFTLNPSMNSRQACEQR